MVLSSKVNHQFGCHGESILDGIMYIDIYDLKYFIMPLIVSTELEGHRASV